MFQYSFMQNAFMISILIGILCPCIGIFLVLRRYSMIGDTLSHASLAGISMGLLVDMNPILGAFLFSSVCGIFIELWRKHFKKYAELLLVIVMSLSVGIAITIISSGKLNVNANSFLFGSILTVSSDDLITVLALSIVTIITLIIFYNKLVLITFDEDCAKIIGVKVRIINYIFSLLVAAAIAVSIRIVGVLVLSSMIALPVASAMQLKKGFKTTLIFSVVFSLVVIITSLIISFYVSAAPGGIIALMSVIMLLCVIVFLKIIRLFKNRR